MPSEWLKNKHKVGADTCTDTKVGKFVLICDESRDRENNVKTGSYLKKQTGNRVNTPKLAGRKGGIQPKFY